MYRNMLDYNDGDMLCQTSDVKSVRQHGTGFRYWRNTSDFILE